MDVSGVTTFDGDIAGFAVIISCNGLCDGVGVDFFCDGDILGSAVDISVVVTCDERLCDGDRVCADGDVFDISIYCQLSVEIPKTVLPPNAYILLPMVISAEPDNGYTKLSSDSDT